MPLETLANIGEFVGGFAVLVSLIYLGIQIRQNTREVRNAAMLRVMEQSVQNFGSPLDLEVGRIVSSKDGDLGIENFSEEEKFLLRRFNFRMWQTLEMVYLQHLEGRISKEFLEAQLGRVGPTFHRELGIDTWKKMGRNMYTASFVAFVDELIEKHENQHTP